MYLKTWIIIVLHLIIWPTLAYGVFLYSSSYEEMSFVKILGSTEKELGLPVFAQFIVTQTLFFDRPLEATRLVVPMYIPEEPLPIKISLYQNGELVSRWRYPLEKMAHQEGVIEAQLPFVFPIQLEGAYEMQFDGSEILHEEQAHAPRLFTESFDQAYPHGNYRIAENEKEGDVAMELFERKTQHVLFMEHTQANMLGTRTRVLIWISALILLACLPSVVLRPFFQYR